jgi:hypothetical protein
MTLDPTRRADHGRPLAITRLEHPQDSPKQPERLPKQPERLPKQPEGLPKSGLATT